jgi:hypothetical protein
MSARRPIALPAAAQRKLRHHPGAGDAAMDLEAEAVEIIGDLFRGALLVEGQFGMGMDIAAKGGDLRRQGPAAVH